MTCDDAEAKIAASSPCPNSEHADYCRCSAQCGTGHWHTQPIGSPWRLRDKAARLLGYHCWDCWRYT